jgi:amidohydrolase
MTAGPSDHLRFELHNVHHEVIATRRDLHRHPELGHEEHCTAALVAERCERLGYRVRTGVGGTGVVADLGGGGPGPTILYRADMDALPIVERDDGRPVRSEVEGVMHACGHDGHVAIALGVAAVMTALKDEWRGTLRLCFQPAEEVANGAQRMIADGALEGVGRAIGLHLWTPLDTGRVAVSPGLVFGSADEFRLTVQGRGGHGGLPHTSIDPVVAAAHIVVALQTLVSREVAPESTAVVTIGRIEGGQAFNVIAEEVHLRGTVRASEEGLRRRLLGRVEELSRAVGAALRCEVEYELLDGCPSVINDPAVADVVRRAAVESVGETSVEFGRPITVGDDFAYFLEKVPGCYFLVGAGDPAKAERTPHHHPAFDIDERALDVGVATASRALLASLR